MSLRSATLQLWALLLGLLGSTMYIQAEDSDADTCLPIPSPSEPSDTNYKALRNLEEQCENKGLQDGQSSAVMLFLRNCSGQMEHGRSEYVDVEHLEERAEDVASLYSGLHLPASVGGGFFLNISCLLESQNELNCSWDATVIPDDAQYSTSGLLCGMQENMVGSWNCTTYRLGNLTGCQGKTKDVRVTEDQDQDHFQIIIRVNVSLSGFWYIHTETFESEIIEKPDPPKIANASFKGLSGNCSLEIQWVEALTPHCLIHEIKIYDEVITLNIILKGVKKFSHLEPNIDRTRKYTVWMRVASLCTMGEKSGPWSDWTKPMVVGPDKEPQPEYSTVMILAIVLGLPMILLVFLLVFCKLQRIVCQPIPRPANRVKIILEKDYGIQSEPEKQAEEFFIEHVTEMDVK
ncbi:uncharacterized protein LOC134092395 [Sardina pilchardus]|uniref:uncharacterized protein LOC134092395 n=1 Tax=Sardina pilchardus TaxID=27697 RepID=UPI002E1397C2